MEPRDIARGRAVWILACGQTLGYACFYYIFAALILAWQADLGWEKTVLASGPTLAILIAAAGMPLYGRLVDSGRGPELLAGGAALGALALAWLATVTTPAGWLTGWAMIGLAQGACLYEVCFAFLIRRLGREARPAIIRVTLVAGFASTLAFPAGAALADALGWRGAVWVAAAVAAFVIVPLNMWGGGMIRRSGTPPVTPSREADRAGLATALRRRAFWLLALALSCIALNHWMIVNFLVPIFVEQGMTQATAVLAASLVGPAQVVGRLALMGVEGRVGTMSGTLLTIVASAVATLLLWLAGIAAEMVFLYALIQGAAAGIATIFRPVIIAEVLGQAGYGAIAGVIQIPALLAGALAPTLGAAILSGPGLGALLGLSLALLLTAFTAIATIRRTS
ncbi:MAG: MFS transporter [Rubellimicrobium sp.]|nr:MFS transporter [Rubellimicrobium sp.]